MYTKYDLKNDLADMGLTGKETILIHSSMKSIGEVDGRADAVLDALMEYFSEGLLLLPTHTWKTINAENNIYDPKESVSCVGILPELFRKREGVVRSLHPTHSMAGFGKRAADYLKGEEYCNTPCTPYGCYDRLRSENAKILLIGVGNERNTFIHSVEEVLNIPHRLSDKPMELIIRLQEGDKRVYMRKHFHEKQPHISEGFVLLDDYFFECGAQTEVRFGDARCLLLDANKVFECVREFLKDKPEYLVDEMIQ